MSLKVLIPILWLANIVAASTSPLAPSISDLPTVASLDKKAKSNNKTKKLKKTKSPKKGNSKKTKEPTVKTTKEPTKKATKKPKKPKKGKTKATKAPKAPKGSKYPDLEIEVFLQMTASIAQCPPQPSLKDEILAAVKRETNVSNVTVESFVFTCNKRRERRLQSNTGGSVYITIKTKVPGRPRQRNKLLNKGHDPDVFKAMLELHNSSAKEIESAIPGLSGIAFALVEAPSASPSAAPGLTLSESPSISDAPSPSNSSSISP